MTKSEFANRLRIIDDYCTKEGLTWYEVTGLEAEDILHLLVRDSVKVSEVPLRTHIWNTVFEVSDEIKEGV